MLLVSVIATIKQRRPDLAKIPIFCHFADVFLDDVPGLPPAREVEFAIGLVPDMTSIMRAPYFMALLKLMEIKE